MITITAEVRRRRHHRRRQCQIIDSILIGAVIHLIHPWERIRHQIRDTIGLPPLRLAECTIADRKAYRSHLSLAAATAATAITVEEEGDPPRQSIPMIVIIEGAKKK